MLCNKANSKYLNRSSGRGRNALLALFDVYNNVVCQYVHQR